MVLWRSIYERTLQQKNSHTDYGSLCIVGYGLRICNRTGDISVLYKLRIQKLCAYCHRPCRVCGGGRYAAYSRLQAQRRRWLLTGEVFLRQISGRLLRMVYTGQHVRRYGCSDFRRGSHIKRVLRT